MLSVYENYSLHVICMPCVCVRNFLLAHTLVLAFIIDTFSPSYVTHAGVLTFIPDTRRCSNLHT